MVKNLIKIKVFGYNDAPHVHCEIHFENVKVPKENLLLGEGKKFLNLIF
jgi:alkylation response protein AidB-like acyl-CoA dehydrogenase